MLRKAFGDRFLTARAGLVVVPDALDQPISLVDARDLAGWLVAVCGRESGPVNTTGPAGMTTLGGLLDTQVLLLPFWLPADVAATAWDVDTTPRPRTRPVQPPPA